MQRSRERKEKLPESEGQETAAHREDHLLKRKGEAPALLGRGVREMFSFDF